MSHNLNTEDNPAELMGLLLLIIGFGAVLSGSQAVTENTSHGYFRAHSHSNVSETALNCDYWVGNPTFLPSVFYFFTQMWPVSLLCAIIPVLP